MSNQSVSSSETRTRLRTTLATIELELARLPPDHLLRASFATLVDQLGLGPEPTTRECPTCKSVGMREATRCMYCWAKLKPPTE